jgi:hypothetical protein
MYNWYQECKNRGQLDELYCDEDNDLVADVPSPNHAPRGVFLHVY